MLIESSNRAFCDAESAVPPAPTFLAQPVISVREGSRYRSRQRPVEAPELSGGGRLRWAGGSRRESRRWRDGGYSALCKAFHKADKNPHLHVKVGADDTAFGAISYGALQFDPSPTGDQS